MLAALAWRCKNFSSPLFFDFPLHNTSSRFIQFCGTPCRYKRIGEYWLLFLSHSLQIESIESETVFGLPIAHFQIFFFHGCPGLHNPHFIHPPVVTPRILFVGVNKNKWRNLTIHKISIFTMLELWMLMHYSAHMFNVPKSIHCGTVREIITLTISGALGNIWGGSEGALHLGSSGTFQHIFIIAFLNCLLWVIWGCQYPNNTCQDPKIEGS